MFYKVAIVTGIILAATITPTHISSGEEDPPRPIAVVEVIGRITPPVMDRIAKCESGGTQFHEDGTVVRGIVNSKDTGMYQINSDIWGLKAQELGHNIETENGNKDMALWLYEMYGTEPWYLSEHCWGV